MAETEDRTKSPVSKLDSLSRDDLAKFVKKQTVLLQRSRAKCEELQKKLESFQSTENVEASESALSTKLLEYEDKLKDNAQRYAAELEELATEKDSTIDDLKHRLTEAQQNSSRNENDARRIRELDEELECMKMKSDTMMSSLQCLTQENTDLQNQLSVLTESRDSSIDTINTLKTKITSLNEKLTLEEKQTRSSVIKIDQLQSECEKYQSEKVDLVDKLNKLESLCKQLEVKNTALNNLQVDSNPEQVAEFDAKIKTLEGKIADLENNLDEQSEKMRIMNNDLLNKEKQGNEKDDEIKELTIRLTEINELVETNKHSYDEDLKQYGEVEREILDQGLKMGIEGGCLRCYLEQVSSWGSQVEKLQKEIYCLESDRNKKAEEVETLQDDISRLNEYVTGLHTERQAEQKEFAKLEELQTLQNQSKSANECESCKQSEMEIEDLKEKLQSSSGLEKKCDCFVLSKKCDEISAQKSMVEYELNEVKGERDMLVEEKSVERDQLKEWEGIMDLLHHDKETSARDLEEADIRLREYSSEVKTIIKILMEGLDESDREVYNDDVFYHEKYDEVLAVRNLSTDVVDRVSKLIKHAEDIAFVQAETSVTIQELKSELDGVHEDNDKLKSQLDTVTGLLDVSQKREQTIVNDYEQVCAEKIRMTEELKEQLTNLDATDNMSDIRSDLEKTKQTVAELERGLAAEQEIRSTVENKYSERCQYVIELETKISELTDKLASLKKTYEIVQTELNSLQESDGSVMNIHDLKQQLEATMNEKLVLENVCKDTEQRVTNLENVLGDMRNAKEELERKVCEYSEKLEMMEQRVSVTDNDMNNIATENASLQQQLESTLMDIASTQEEATALRVTAVERDKLVVTNERLLETKQNFEGQLEQMLLEHENLLEKYEELQKVHAHVANEGEDKTNMILKLKLELDEKIETIDSLQTVANDTGHKNDKALRSLQTNNEAMQSENETLLAEVSKLKIELSEVGCEKEKVDGELVTLKNLLENKSKQVEELVASLESGDDESNQLKAMYKEKLEESNNARMKLEEEKLEVHRELEHLKIQHSNFVALSEEEKKNINSQISEITRYFNDEKVKNSKMEEVCRLNEKSESDLKEETLKLTQCIEENKRTHERLQKELESENNKVCEMELNIESLQSDINELKETVKQHKLTENDLNENIENLQQSVLKYNAEYEELFKKQNSTIATLKLLFSELKYKCDVVEDVSDDSDFAEVIHKWSDVCRSLIGQNEQLEKEVRTVRTESQEKINNISDEAAKIQSGLRDNWEKAIADGTELTKRLEEKEESYNALAERCNHLDQEKSELIEKCRILNARTETLVQNSQEQLLIDKLKNEVKTKDDMASKLKTMVVRYKKEISEMKAIIQTKEGSIKAVESLNASNQAEANNIDELKKHHAQEISQLKSELKNYQEKISALETSAAGEEMNSERLTSKLEHISHELTKEREVTAGLQAQLDSSQKALSDASAEKMVLKNSIEDLQTTITKLESLRDDLLVQKAELQKELTNAAEQNKQEISKLNSQFDQLNKQLLDAKQEVKQSSMIDLEMADYERSMKKLNEDLQTSAASVSERDGEIERLSDRVTQLLQQTESSDKQYSQAEERANKLKQLLVKSKKDLAEAKKIESDQKIVEAQLRGQVESLVQHSEEYKLQMAEMSNENVSLKHKLQFTQESHERALKSQELKLQQMQTTLVTTQGEMATLQADYEAYKVRVHNVLKQQKTKQHHETILENEKSERLRLENLVDQMRAKLQESSNAVQLLKQENEVLTDDNDRLLQTHETATKHRNDLEASYKRRIEQLTKEQQLSFQQFTENINLLKTEKTMLETKYDRKKLLLQEDHKRAITMLNNQLKELKSVDKHLPDVSDTGDVTPTVNRPVSHKLEKELVESVVDLVTDIRHVERQAAEGMENIEPGCAKVPSPTNQQPSIIPFDQLLSVSLDDSMSLKSGTSHDDERQKYLTAVDNDKLKEVVTESQKRIEHLTEVLSDSEATVLRLTEQTRILKEEIRRLERNQLRQQETQNLEYLKNILLKFLSLKPGEDRSQLLPVMQTMLKLNEDEKDMLGKVAQGDEGTKAPSTGWGSYLHRWSSVM